MYRISVSPENGEIRDMFPQLRKVYPTTKEAGRGLSDMVERIWESPDFMYPRWYAALNSANKEFPLFFRVEFKKETHCFLIEAVN